MIVDSVGARLVFILATVGLASAARAGTASDDESFQKQVFSHAIGKDGARACFRRVYESEHLASHPQQRVRTMLLLLSGYASAGGDPPFYKVGINVTFRKSGSHFETYGDCGYLGLNAGPGNQNVAHCGIDCDGGSIDVKVKDATSVLVAIPDGAMISKVSGVDPADPDQQLKRFGPDDKLFRLDKTALTDCLPLATEDKDKAAIRHGL